MPIVRRVPESEQEVQTIREKVYANVGVRGIHVSFDDKAALVTAGLWEEGTDFVYLWQRVNQLQETYQDDNTRLYVTGYPMLYAWVQHYYPTYSSRTCLHRDDRTHARLLFSYADRGPGPALFRLPQCPLGTWVCRAVWVSSRSRSCWSCLSSLPPARFHTQCNRWNVSIEEYVRLGDKHAAIVSSYLSLFDPAFVSIAADALALLTLAVARIPVIQNLAFVASFWILTIAVSVITLHPVLLTFLPPPTAIRRPERGSPTAFIPAMCRFLVWLSQENRRYVSVVC